MKNKILQKGKILASVMVLFSVLFVSSLLPSCSKEEPIVPGVNNAAIESNAKYSCTPAIPQQALIYISHEGCYGTCPVYSVMVWRNSNYVSYIGYRNVAALGSREFYVSPRVIQMLKDMMLENGIFKMYNCYPVVPDAPRTVTALQIDPELTKIIVDYGIEVPQELNMMRNKIESTLGIDRLVNGIFPVATNIDPVKN